MEPMETLAIANSRGELVEHDVEELKRNAKISNVMAEPPARSSDTFSEVCLDEETAQNSSASTSITGTDNEAPPRNTWSKKASIVAYTCMMVLMFLASLEGQVSFSVIAFAVSSFNAHSTLSTIFIIQGILNAVVKLPMAKIADVFGRLRTFALCVALYVLGYIQLAAAPNIVAFVIAQVFYSAGFTGLQISCQIFIADTSSLRNRTFLSNLPAMPFVINMLIGPNIGKVIMDTASWRWAYGMWAIILPVAFIPLAICLFLHNRKEQRLGIQHQREDFKGAPLDIAKKLWLHLDVGGIILLATAVALILLPLTLSASADQGWASPHIVAMLVLGSLLLLGFGLWEASPRLAPQPLIPLALLRCRTFVVGCGLVFFFMAIYDLVVQPYFVSYLMVTHALPVTLAGYVTEAFGFAAIVASTATAFLIRHARRYRPFVLAGGLVYLLALGLTFRFRRAGAPLACVVAAQVVLGAGGGLLLLPAQTGVQGSVARAHVATATACYLTMMEVGGAVGAAVSGVVWTRLIPAKLALYLPEGARPHAHDIYGDIKVATAYPVGSPERFAIDRAYHETMHSLVAIALGCAVPIILLSLAMKGFRIENEQQQPGEEAAAALVNAEKREGENVGADQSRKLTWDPSNWIRMIIKWLSQ
ncbi:putative siderochrome-iron transporter [Xylariaceae sp. FL0016]|nr:putative siderochrome-iron transporter [Xylariaceae sp. FL0016]